VFGPEKKEREKEIIFRHKIFFEIEKKTVSLRETIK